MKKGKHKEGWTKKKRGQRRIRDREHGLLGQEVWYSLQKHGFVHKGKHFQKEKNDPLAEWEIKLKNWLIWGYWELDR